MEFSFEPARAAAVHGASAVTNDRVDANAKPLCANAKSAVPSRYCNQGASLANAGLGREVVMKRESFGLSAASVAPEHRYRGIPAPRGCCGAESRKPRAAETLMDRALADALKFDVPICDGFIAVGVRADWLQTVARLQFE